MPANNSVSIGVAGDFIDKVKFVDSISMSLVTCVGTNEETKKDVLVPFVSLSISGRPQMDDASEADVKEQVLFSNVLSVENTAYVVADTIVALLASLQQLEKLSSGSLKMDPQRVDVVAKFVKAGQERLGECVEAVERLRATK